MGGRTFASLPREQAHRPTSPATLLDHGLSRIRVCDNFKDAAERKVGVEDAFAPSRVTWDLACWTLDHFSAGANTAEHVIVRCAPPRLPQGAVWLKWHFP